MYMFLCSANTQLYMVEKRAHLQKCVRREAKKNLLLKMAISDKMTTTGWLWSRIKFQALRTKHYSFLMGLWRLCVKSTQPLLDNDKTDILKYSMKRAKSRENVKFSAKKFLT